MKRRPRGGLAVLPLLLTLGAGMAGGASRPADELAGSQPRSGQSRPGETGTLEVPATPVERDDIRDIKPLREPRSRAPDWVLMLLGAIPALAVLGALLLAHFRRRGAPARAPATADMIALEALSRLPVPARDQPEAVRRFAFRLSEIVRRYIEERFGLNATDLTTEEILPKLRGLRPSHPEAEALLTRVLCWTDRVKFSEQAASPGAPELAARVDEARRLIEVTRPAPEVEA